MSTFTRPDPKLGHLACAKNVFPHIDRVQTKAEPVFATLTDFWEKYKGNAQIEEMLQNKIKKCPKCGKPCAFTLQACNSCGEDITNVAITFTANIFTSFIFGIGKDAFPFTISVRSESERLLAFDDLLGLSPCHLNLIPTFTHIKDWRFLLLAPKAGLELVEQLYAEGLRILKAHYWGNPDFRSKFYIDIAESELEDIIISGCNYPPSQYQLHLQFMTVPLIPFQYKLYLNGCHFTHERFFPYRYITAVLRDAIEHPPQLVITDQSGLTNIIDHFKARGIDYNAIHAEDYARYEVAGRKVSQWQESDFGAYMIGEEVQSYDDPPPEDASLPAAQVQNKDKTVITNYGRPLTAEGKPTGSYYSFTKTPCALEPWPPTQ